MNLKPNNSAATQSPSSKPAPIASNAASADKDANQNMIFPKKNILMMLGCVALIIIGFLLMTGGSSTAEGGFNPDIFSTRRIVIGPTIAFLGFLLMAFAIVWTPRKKKDNNNDL